jgi:hypothetical protein
MRTIVVLFCTAWLAACVMTPVVWTKADATPDLVSLDVADCRRLAFDEMWRLGWERNWPPVFYDPLFMPPYYHGRQAFWLDFPLSIERERALVEFCMHSKGYRLEHLPY